MASKECWLDYLLLLAVVVTAHFAPLGLTASAAPASETECALARFRPVQSMTSETLDSKKNARFECLTPVLASSTNGEYAFALSFADKKNSDEYYVVSNLDESAKLEEDKPGNYRLLIPVLATNEAKRAQKWLGTLEISFTLGESYNIRNILLWLVRDSRNRKNRTAIGGQVSFNSDDSELLGGIAAVAEAVKNKKQGDSCREGELCCYQKNSTPRTFFNPKKFFKRFPEAHRQCQSNAVSCCYASGLEDGTYGCDDSSQSVDLTFDRKWQRGKVTSKQKGKPKSMEEELCRFNINQCNVFQGTTDKTCTYSISTIDMQVSGAITGKDKSELPGFGNFGPNNQFRFQNVDGQIVINMPHVVENTDILRMVEACDAIKEIVRGTFETKRTQYFFGGVEYCTLSDSGGGSIAKKEISRNKAYFGTATSTEKKLLEAWSIGIDCKHPQQGCSPDQDFCDGFYAYQTAGACGDPIEDTPIVEDPVPTEEAAPEATASTEKGDPEPPTDPEVTPKLVMMYGDK